MYSENIFRKMQFETFLKIKKYCVVFINSKTNSGRKKNAQKQKAV